MRSLTVMPPADPAVLQPRQLSDQTETHDMSSEERREREAAGIRQQQSNGPYTFYAPAASNAATIAQPNQSMMAQIAELQNIVLSNNTEISQLKAMLKQIKDEENIYTLKVQFGSALADEAQANAYITIPGLKGMPAKEISVKN